MSQQRHPPKKKHKTLSPVESIEWILKSLPHPTSHSDVITVTHDELDPISSAVSRRWNLYHEIRSLHSSGRYSEVTETVGRSIADANGDIASLIGDTSILDLVLDSYFAVERFGEVIRIFDSVRTLPEASLIDPLHPKIVVGVTSYCLAIESVLLIDTEENGVSRAAELYRDCVAKFGAIPQVVMAFFRGLGARESSSLEHEDFALAEFRRVAPEHQFSVSDVREIAERCLNNSIEKLQRIHLTTAEAFAALQPMLSVTHSENYKRALLSIVPAVIRKLDISSVEFLELMRTSFSYFHPTSELIDACVAAEMLRANHDPLKLAFSLETSLRHPRATTASPYLRWVRTDSVETLAIQLVNQGHIQNARSILRQLLEMQLTVSPATFRAVMSSFLTHEDFTELQLVIAAFKRSKLPFDPSAWNLLVLANLGKKSDAAQPQELPEAEVDRRIAAAIVVFDQFYSLARTNAAQLKAELVIEDTLERLVDWAAAHKSARGLQRIVSISKSTNLVSSAPIARALEAIGRI